ncbi:MAG TPA: hypothetical protein VLD57_11810, partial [Blastocatellia bacterium]|nr:hypothetical protein [Blastocatellia bacterium]
MRTGNIEPDNLETPDEGAAAGTFFRKYGPRQSLDASAENKFFKRYDLAQDEETENFAEQVEPERVSPAADNEYLIPEDQKTEPEPVFTRLRLFSALVLAAIL